MARVVATPFTPPQQAARSRRHPAAKSSARKQLLADDAAADPAHADELKVMKAPSTPSRSARSGAAEDADTPAKVKSGEKAAAAPGKATKQLFGKASNNCSAEVVQMYKVVNKCTGSLGGNGSGGAIYGELTKSSMQKVTELLVNQAGLGPESVFVDVGAGLGKPNLHVAIDPGVKYSVGIEMEHVRWLLSLHNLKHYLDDVSAHRPEASRGNCVFMHGDAWAAKSFDPFTHVYMFDIGFPPKLFLHLADCLRASATAKWVLCYHAPHLMIEKYGFSMEFVEKQATSMHGSSEGHTAYLYKCTHAKARKPAAKPAKDAVAASDPLWRETFEVLSQGDSAVAEWVAAKQAEDPRMNGTSARPRTRAQSQADA